MERATHGVRLEPVGWGDLPGWAGDDHAAALAALGRTARHVLDNGPHKTGALGLEGAAHLAALRASLAVDPAEARAFFERHYEPRRIVGERLGGPDGGGFVTGFYEPTLEASDSPDAAYRYPIHARPHGLGKADEEPSDLPPGYEWGWRGADGVLREAPDRAAVEGEGAARDWPVIAWARDRVDLFFAHVQGAARLAMPDGSIRRITYAGKTGHPFTGVGSELVREGELAADAVTMDSIRAWLAAHPGRVDEMLRRNRSYILFREAEVSDPALGPVAAARVPLAAGRSLAVDRRLHTFGTPIHVDAPALGYEGVPFARLMVAQETGTAIVGAARGDIFTGSGDAAGKVAGAIRHAATFTALVPRTG